jgi:hypothetical protein
VLPVAGVVALLESLTTGEDLSAAFPRMLWSPNVADRVDQQLGVELRKLLADQAAGGPRVSIEDARKVAYEEYTRRMRADRSPEDLEVDTHPMDDHVAMRESVYLGLGRAVEDAKRRQKMASTAQARRPGSRRKL